MFGSAAGRPSVWTSGYLVRSKDAQGRLGQTDNRGGKKQNLAIFGQKPEIQAKFTECQTASGLAR
jgi:hypothetical protein